MILAGQFAGEREVKRFRGEAEAAARLDHPNIVPIYEVGEQDGRAFYSMKFMEGGTLTAQLAARTTPLDCREAASLLVKVARAVHHAHQRAILHRDIKPGNILLDAQGEPHVSDFGLAKCLDSAEGLTLSGAMLGSPNYMSPEQAAGESERLTTASDTYSLGALLYQLLTGHPPFEAPTAMATMKRVIEDEAKKPRVINAAVDHDLETICLKCLEKDPQRRYASADALAEELERWLRGEPIKARPISSMERLIKWTRRNPKVATLVILLNVVFAVALAIGTWMSLRLAAANRGQQQANRSLQRIVRDFEWQKIDDLIATGKRSDAIAYLSHFLRLDPTDRLAATRIVSMMSGCNFVLPAGAPLRHTAGVNNMTLSLDGQRLLTAADDGKVRLWELPTAKLLTELAHPTRVLMASFTGDERFVITSCHDGAASLWDLAKAEIIFRFPKAPDGALGGTLTHDRRRVALAESETSMQVWDLARHEQVGSLLRVPMRIRWTVFSPDDQEIAMASMDGTVRSWKVETSEPVISSFKVKGDVTRTQFSPDGKILAVIWEGMIALLDAHSGAKLREFQAHDTQVLWIEFAPDGRRLISMAYNRPPKIWDLATGQTLGRPIEAERPFANFHLSADGRRLATYSDNGVARVWDALTGLPLSEPFEHEGPIWDLTFSTDGRFIFTASQDGHAQIWETGAARPRSFEVETADAFPSACFSADGRRVICTTKSRAEIFDVASGERVGKPIIHAGQIYRMKLSPDGKKLGTAAWDNTGRIWSAQTGEPLTPPLPHRFRLFAIAFSPDGRLLATGSADSTARLWNAETGAPVEPTLTHQAAVMHLDFRPDSHALLTASKDATAQLWSTDTGQPLWPEPLRHLGIVWTAEFSPDGRRIVTASADKSAVVWDAESRRPLTRPMLHERSVYAAHFSPDGRWVLTCSEDGTARVWDASSGEPIPLPMRHKDKLKNGAFSPDGRMVFTGSEDGVARLWDAWTGYPLSEPLRHLGEITCIQFSPDGRRCLSIAGSDALRLWDVVNAPAPAPPWFSEFVEAVAGKRLNAHGEAEYVPRQSLQTFQDRFRDRGGTDFYSRWAHWFLHERLKEPVPAFDPGP